jgi:hypothetical protein
VAREGFNGLSEVPLDFWAPLTMSPQLEEGPSLFGVAQPSGSPSSAVYGIH